MATRNWDIVHGQGVTTKYDAYQENQPEPRYTTVTTSITVATKSPPRRQQAGSLLPVPVATRLPRPRAALQSLSRNGPINELSSPINERGGKKQYVRRLALRQKISPFKYDRTASRGNARHSLPHSTSVFDADNPAFETDPTETKQRWDDVQAFNRGHIYNGPISRGPTISFTPPCAIPLHTTLGDARGFSHPAFSDLLAQFNIQIKPSNYEVHQWWRQERLRWRDAKSPLDVPKRRASCTSAWNETNSRDQSEDDTARNHMAKDLVNLISADRGEYRNVTAIDLREWLQRTILTEPAPSIGVRRSNNPLALHDPGFTKGYSYPPCIQPLTDSQATPSETLVSQAPKMSRTPTSSALVKGGYMASQTSKPPKPTQPLPSTKTSTTLQTDLNIKTHHDALPFSSQLSQPAGHLDFAYWLRASEISTPVIELSPHVFISSYGDMAPYLSVVIDDLLDDPADGLTQTSISIAKRDMYVLHKLVAHGATRLYNRYVIWQDGLAKARDRESDAGKMWRERRVPEDAELLHFGITIRNPRFCLYVFKPLLLESDEWRGCEVEALLGGYLRVETDVQELSTRINEIQDWAATLYKDSIKKSVEGLLRPTWDPS